jgi:hypothetical protein
MKKKNLGSANEDDYGPATDRLRFLEMLMEAGHIPKSVVVVNEKKGEKGEKKT